MAQPVFRQLWYSSTIQRQLYQSMRSKASSRLSTGTEVSSSHSIGSTPFGGEGSQGGTTQARSLGGSPGRLEGERRVTSCQPTRKSAVRAACPRLAGGARAALP